MRIPNNSIFTFDFIDSSELWLNPTTKSLYIKDDVGIIELISFMRYHVSQNLIPLPNYISDVSKLILVTKDSLIAIGHHDSINLIGYKRLVFTTLFFQYLNSNLPIYITQSYYSNHHNIEYNIDFLDHEFNDVTLHYNNIYLVSVIDNINDDLNSLNFEYSYDYEPDDCDIELSTLSFVEPVIPVITTPNTAAINNMLELYYKDHYDVIGTNIILKFDSVNVSNSKGLSHTIYDMYIKLNMSNNFDRLLRIEGKRCKVKLIEYISKYKFSHLSDSGWERWSHFCFGNNTVMSNLTSMLVTSEFNLILFEALLLQLPQYLSWESLEGGPYKRIANISYGSQQSYFSIDHNRLVDTIEENILPNLIDVIELNITRYNLHNIYSIRETPQLERTICNIVMKNNLLHNQNIPTDYPLQQVKNFVTGEYSNIEVAKDKDNNEHKLLVARYNKIKSQLPTISFRFKNEDIRLELIPENFEGNNDLIEENKFIDNDNIVLNPYIYKPIIDHINKKLESLIIKKLPYEYNTQYINSREESSVA